jgi:hypothetical protein
LGGVFGHGFQSLLARQAPDPGAQAPLHLTMHISGTERSWIQEKVPHLGNLGLHCWDVSGLLILVLYWLGSSALTLAW